MEDRTRFRDAFEGFVNSLTPLYIANDSVITETVLQTIVQGDDTSQNQVATTTTLTYSICFAAQRSSSADVDSYPSDYVNYMSVTSNRRALEDHWKSIGIPVQTGSLSSVSLLEEVIPRTPTSPSPSGSSNQNALIAGLSVGAVVLVLASVFWVRQRRQKAAGRFFDTTTAPGNHVSGESHGSRLSLSDSEVRASTLPVLLATPIEVTAANAEEVGNPTDIYNVQYKDQGQSVVH